MAYAMPGQRRQRPSVVTAAGYLLFGVAALAVLSAIVSASTYSRAIDQLKLQYANDPNQHDLLNGAKVGIGFGVVIDVLGIVLIVLLGVFVLRGSNGMRITAWVIAGIGVLCCGIGSIGTTLTSFSSNSGGDTTQVNVNDIVPSWARHVGQIDDILGALALILVIIFLALPASNAFFRKQPQMVGYPSGGGWVQPMSDPGYPPIPGYTPGTWAPPSVTQQSAPPSYPASGYEQPGYQQPGYQPPHQPSADQPQSAPPVSPPPSAPPASGPPSGPPSGNDWPPQGPVS